MAGKNFACTVDKVQKLITIRYKGHEAGAWYIDQTIDAYRSIPEIWTYNKLLDHRQFDGLVAFEDIERLGRVWAGLTKGRPERPRVAMLSPDALKRARSSVYAEVFPNQTFAAFVDLHAALDWLSGKRNEAA